MFSDSSSLSRRSDDSIDFLSKLEDYKPVERGYHSTVQIGECVYMWGGYQRKKRNEDVSSIIDVFHLPSGMWETQLTSNTPPQGIYGYACTAIDREIFFFGGYCTSSNTFQNSLFSFNTDADVFSWRKLSPTSPSHGRPMMKAYAGIVAVQVGGSDYIAVIGGQGSSSTQQANALYDSQGFGSFERCNEVHYYKLLSGEWESPVVTGNRPPPISGFTIESLSKNTALLFGGATITFGHNSCIYIVTFTRKVNFVKISNPGGSVKWPPGRSAHSSVIIDHGSSGQHLLVIGVNDCWVLDITNKTWKEVVTLPDFVTKRNHHSLSAWSVTPVTSWIVQFGGYRGRKLTGDTTIIEFRYNTENDWSVDVIPPDQYQDKLRERKQEWEESQVIHRQRDKIIEQSQTEQGIIEERLQPLDHEEVREQSKRDQQNEEQNHQGHQEQNTDELLVLEQKFLKQLQEKEKEFERVIQEKDEELRQVKNEFQEREQELLKQLQQAESSWVLDKEEITITEELVGKGSWGEVKVGIYCDLRVAAKCLHDVIISHYNISTFLREMNIASKVRHPNLLQFIGATKEGNPIILTELMHTSLRKELETSSTMPYPVVLSISLDVACALNYLHLFKPHPILHRDVSSPNVLLQPVGNGWRAKLSDYGSANLQHLIGFTANPGSPIYSAPEATNPHNHSPAMDVYSFAVLLIEMLTCQLPEPKERQTQLSIAVKDHVTIRHLLVACLNNEYKSRPSMSDVIRELKREI